VPWGLLNLATGAVFLVLGSSAETSDFWADCLWLWWRQAGRELAGLKRLRIRLDNGPNCASNRRQWIKRLIELADGTGLEIHLVHYPPYHSKYNPIERVWGILEKHWNGALLVDLQTAMNWAATMTWNGQQPQVSSLDNEYHKGATISDKEWCLLQARLERSATLPKWDVVIKPKNRVG
jgi:Rhodopirellula transposase DDE domain